MSVIIKLQKLSFPLYLLSHILLCITLLLA
uniref:Uncharacterized protein n=1 Tax=Arundo donax TaxID=35708 RepID=A0A0A9FCJ9_ARUDO